MVSAHMQGGDPCEEAPSLRLGASNVEIAASAAPRPMLIVSSTHDWTRDTPSVEYPAIRRIYELYGRAQDVGNAHIDAEHNYNSASRAAVYRFFGAHLLRTPPTSEFIERTFQLPPEQELLAYPRGDLPPGTQNIAEVFQNWKIAARLRIEENTSVGELRDSLRQVFGVEIEPEVESFSKGDQIVLSRSGKRDRISGYWYPGKGSPVLILSADGARLARGSDLAKEVIGTGRPVLLIDPFEASRDRAALARSDPYFYSYNRSDDAERVQDILTALDFLHSTAKGKPEIIGVGKAGIAAVFAAAIAPMEVSLIADLNGFSGSDEDFTEHFFVPGIQHAGGLNAALRLINSMRVVVPAENR
jgi:hypothetical protein